MDLLAQLDTFFLVLSFALGCLTGSFCNVCICRWPAGESVVSPRSRCPRCMQPVAWYDNIPLVSWLALGAKCRHCSLPISWQYPVVEGLTGVLFVLVYWRFGFSIATPIYFYLCAALVIVTFVDLAEWIIPNEITFTGIPFGLALAVVAMFLPESGLRVVDPLDALAGIALGGGILYALDKITVLLLKKPGMGFGDVKLLAMLGAFLGWQGVLGTLMLACLLGSALGLTLILASKMRGGAPAEDDAAPGGDGDGDESAAAPLTDDEGVELEGHYIPFGPYLAAAGVAFLFVGPEAIAWYLSSLEGAALAPLLLD